MKKKIKFTQDELQVLYSACMSYGNTLSDIMKKIVGCNELEDGNYKTVEVYTSERVKGFGFLYENSPFTYGHVPVETMEEICKIHGGIC